MKSFGGKIAARLYFKMGPFKHVQNSFQKNKT